MDRSSISRSNPESFSSSSVVSDASSSSVQKLDHSAPGAADLSSSTPTSVLPQTSGDWFDMHTELYEAFKMIDKDDDGFISRIELKTLLTRIGPKPPTAEEISLMLSEVDDDGPQGCVRLEMLMNQVVFTACEPTCEPELKVVFDCFDEDHDRRIKAEELLRFLLIGNDGFRIESEMEMVKM